MINELLIPASVSALELAAIAPFAVLLLAIAILPLVPAAHHWWEENHNKLIVAGALGAVTLGYYAWRGDEHHTVGAVVNHAVLADYIPFMMLLFSLFTICGGIRIAGDLLGTPAVNTTFLAIGALAASFLGTTGASMLLIRPLLDVNSGRRHVVHTVVFFIFLVSNIGGCILPIGDPPLFIGFLKGIPFLWTVTLWKEWAFCTAILLAVYYVWDRIEFSREPHHKSWTEHRKPGALHYRGMQNFAWLALVVLTVATVDGGPHPERPIPLLGLATPPFLREALLLALTAAAWFTTDATIRAQNRFTFTAILEVAALFIGIFITMQPALELLKEHGAELGIVTPMQFFWVTGSLSAVLDNAPTYVVFLETAKSLHGGNLSEMYAGPGEPLLIAVSLGAVFMGAMTYIGNGPNFMVKSIAEGHKIPMPGFFGYIGYSAAILLPLFLAMSLIFL